MRTGPKPLVDEYRYVPATLEEADQLYEAIERRGYSLAICRAVTAWCIRLRHVDDRADDRSSDVQRRDYRKVLASIGAPPWESQREAQPSGAIGGYINSRARRIFGRHPSTAKVAA